jgi:hypothetical protein
VWCKLFNAVEETLQIDFAQRSSIRFRPFVASHSVLPTTSSMEIRLPTTAAAIDTTQLIAPAKRGESSALIPA